MTRTVILLLISSLFCLLQAINLNDSYNFNPFDQIPYVTKNNEQTELSRKLENALKLGLIRAKTQFGHNKWLPSQGIHMTRNSSGFFRFNTGAMSRQLINRHHTSNIIKKGLEVYLVFNRFQSTKQIMDNLYDEKLKVGGICQEISINCSELLPMKYRTIDGCCNNLKHPFWGAAQFGFTRLTKAAYEDGIHKPRLSVTGNELPSAREITLQIFNSDVIPDSKLTLMASQMAQIIAHDTQQAVPDNIEGGPIKCCTDSGNNLPFELMHSSCMPISVPPDDPVFGINNFKCMNFIRSVTVPAEKCIISPAEQINLVTSFLDCSFIYGSSNDMSNTLRVFRDGLLLQSSPKKFRMLPLADPSLCDCRNNSDVCYIAGDSRVNQNPHLVAMQVTFLREHNRIAKELLLLNPHWKDEKLFQETRRIVIAIYQHIVYKEFLPLFIGQQFIDELFSSSDSNGHTYNYDKNINPGSINSMNIVFRCFHSTLPNTIRLCNNSGVVKSEHKFSDYLARPVLCCQNHDEILNSLCINPMMKISDCATTEIRDKLFKSQSVHGLDLISMDIKRERDHGIPGYNEFRKVAGLEAVSSFEELTPYMNDKKVKKLQNIYKHVDDVDLIIGAQLEKQVEGTQFGPVILYIIREQFYRYMRGDKFFYTNKNQDYPFTPEQLKEIQKATIARLVCDNGNKIDKVQKRAFEIETKDNPKASCTEIPMINLNPWKEN